MLGVPPTAVAAPTDPFVTPYGNYNMIIPDRTDFHTWVWAITPCGEGCLYVAARPQPIAKALASTGQARLDGGRYSLTVDDPYGLRCDNIYYGPTISTHDIYSWDAATLAGSMKSTFDIGCNGAPGGTITYPFTLSRM